MSDNDQNRPFQTNDLFLNHRRDFLTLIASSVCAAAIPTALAEEVSGKAQARSAGMQMMKNTAQKQERMTEAKAWEKYLADLQIARQTLVNVPWFNWSPMVRVRGIYFLHSLIALAYNTIIAPRQAYPQFGGTGLIHPNLYDWTAPSPDTRYEAFYLDGTRTYRFWGKRGSSRLILIQTLRGAWGEPDIRAVHGSQNLDDFKISEDGSFEVLFSATPQKSNWIELDPKSRNNFVLIRQSFYDWEKEVGAEFHIEAADGQRPPFEPDEEELGRRIAIAGELVKYAVDNFIVDYGKDRWKHTQEGKVFWLRKITEDVGGSPFATYGSAFYQLDKDSAMIIEMDMPKDVRYWNLQLEDMWGQTVDYYHHKSSINGTQAVTDRDGKFRAVLALTDPGVPNWLDPVENDFGFLFLRYYIARDTPTPTLKKVPLSKLRNYLPKETPVVTPKQREEEIRKRSLAIDRRYGFRS